MTNPTERVMTTDPDVYFAKGCGRCDKFDTPACKTKTWAKGLARLRAVCLKAGLVETAKWGHPCYMHAGRNIALIGAFNDNFRLTFMNASLLKDPHKILVRRGPNTQHPDMICFTDADQVTEIEPILLAYLNESMGYAERGIKPKATPQDVTLPNELIEALDSDPELAEAFHALTPGRQKSYVLNLNSAKQSATRRARILKFRDKIIAGKGALER